MLLRIFVRMFLGIFVRTFTGKYTSVWPALVSKFPALTIHCRHTVCAVIKMDENLIQ